MFATRNDLNLELRSRATSGRDEIICPNGNAGYGFVATGNLLLGRICLICLLLSCRKVRWLLEQPSMSAVVFHPWMDFLQKRVYVP